MFNDVYGCYFMVMLIVIITTYRKHMKTLENYRLVGGLEQFFFLFFHILGIMIPTD